MRRYHKWAFAPDMLDDQHGSTDRCQRCGALRYWGVTNIRGYAAAEGADITAHAPACKADGAQEHEA